MKPTQQSNLFRGSCPAVVDGCWPLFTALSRFRLFNVMLAAILLACALSGAAHAVAPIGNNSSPGVTDLVKTPKQFYSFDPGVITWKMTDQFKDVFATPVLQDQVRLAFREWEVASSSALRRNDGPGTRYSWARFNGDAGFLDLQSTLIHEIGHAIGSQHPDAAWANGTPQYMRNFRKDDNGDWFATAPLGGEIMNEGNAVKSLGGSKGLMQGEYWRTVSKDEIAFLDHAYGSSLDFVEVGQNDDAMIVVDVFGTPGVPFGGNLGTGGPDNATAVYRVPGDVTQGKRIGTATAGVNRNAPLGMVALSQAWDITNQTGEAIDGLSIRARGSSNPWPIAATSGGQHRFTTYEPSNAISATHFEDRSHRFLNPEGGSIPNGFTASVGLQLDVWDWTVVSATARTVNGNTEGVPLSTPGIGSWYNFQEGELDEPKLSDDLLSGLTAASVNNVPSQGFFVQPPEDIGTTITKVSIGRVSDPYLTPDALNQDLLTSLRDQNALHEFDLTVNPIRLAAGEQFYFALKGLVDDLPTGMQGSGRFRLLSLPEIADDPLVVFVQTESSDFKVGAYALLNSGLIGTVPEPTSIMLVASAFSALAILGRRKR